MRAHRSAAPASYQVTDSVRARTERFGGFHVGGNPNTDPHMAYEARGIPREACTTGLDGDGDGHRGCDDPDCWAVCTPLCPPYLPACPADAPRCGDGTCDPLEACTSCALDCGACVGGTCGDGRCDPDEADGGGCPGDCGA
jgi:hypothetical protein